MKQFPNTYAFFTSIKYTVCFICFALLFTTASYAQTTYSVGATGGTHTTIAAAYDACTSPKIDYIIEIQSNYNIAEASKGITLGVNTANSIIIRPQKAPILITAALSGPIFNFSGAKNVTIDGRPDGTGTAALTIQNTNATVNASPVLLFMNGATNNSIQFCSIQGSNPNTSSTTGGVICFKAAGCDANTIDNCTIQAVGINKPAIAILSRMADTGGGNNSNITISNCNIVDFTSKGIWVTNPANTGWTIQNNSFYQSAAFALSTPMEMISIGNGSDYVISGNYLGGQAPKCGGSNFTITSGTYTTFRGINILASGTNTLTNNTIQNISFSGSNYASIYAFTAIYLRGNGDFTCGGAAGLGNTIGSLTTSGSIKFKNTLATGGSAGFCAIRDSSVSSTKGFSKTISYNSIGGIDINADRTGQISDIISITNGSASGTIIDNNTIGTTKTAPINNSGLAALNIINHTFTTPFFVTNNKIQGVSQSNADGVNALTIIKGNGNGNMTCTDNTINDIASVTNSLVSIINYAGGASNTTVGKFVNNTISAISLSNTGINCGLNIFDISSPSSISLDRNFIDNILVAGNKTFNGMLLTSSASPVSITDNTIQNVTLTSTGTGNNFIGIGVSGGSGIVTCSGNTIQHISSATSSATPSGCIYIDDSQTSNSVYGTNISDIQFTNAIAANSNYGIYLSGATKNGGGTAENNLITGLSNKSSATTSAIIGIQVASASNWILQNNVILLDNSSGGTTSIVTGINLSLALGQIYNNTIKLYGSQTGSNGSSCIATTGTSGTYTIKSNIFQNIRTGGTGYTYAENYSKGSTIATNYNYLESTSTTLAAMATAPYSITTWQGSIAPASISGTASIDASGKVTSIPFAGAGKGATPPPVSTDIIGTIRSTSAPWMGAYEGFEISTSPVSPASFCPGTKINVSFVVYGATSASTVFTVQLSNAKGSFATPVSIGSGTTSTIPKTGISSTIPLATVAGTGYRIRVISSSPTSIGVDNGTDLTVNALPTITLTPDFSVCANQTSATVSATITNATGVLWSTTGSGTFAPSTTNLKPIYDFTAADVKTGSVKLTAVTTGSTCTAVSGSTTITFTPVPTLTTAIPANICSNNKTNILLTSSPTGATFSWTRSAVTGIAPATGSGTTTPIVEILTNTNTVATTVNYVITSTLAGCTGTSTLVQVINPLPIVTPASPATICSETSNSIPLSASIAGSTFTWTRSAVTGITPSTGTGTANPIIETINNTTTAPITVSYTVTPTANGCVGTTASISQVIKPLPTVNAASPAAICTGNPTAIALSSTPASATFAWNRTAVTNITPATGSGTTSTIAETLTSSSTNSTTVVYTVIPTLNGCTGTSRTIVQTITPSPTITVGTNQTVCASVNSVAITAPTLTNATGFYWTSSGTGTFTPNSTSTNSVYNLTSADKTAGKVTLTATTTGNGVCTAVSNSFVVAITPLPTVTAVTPPTICSGTSSAISLTSTTPGTTFAWLASGTPTGYSNTSGNTISQTLFGNGTVTYIVTPTANGCAGPTYTIPVTVQVPVITPAALAPGVLGASYSKSFSVTVITTPTWSLIGVPPAGLTLSSSGLFSGTPTTSNTYSFNIKVAQGACSVTLPYTFGISSNSTTWNGSSWSNGAPSATVDAILDANYATTATETFTAYNLTINSGNTFTVNGNASVTANGNLINNGVINQKCSAVLNVIGIKSGNAVAIQLPVISPSVLNNGKVNTNYSQTTPFSVSFGIAPTYTANGLPTGLDITKGENKISGSTLLSGTFPITITTQDGICSTTSQPINLLIVDLTNPNLQFTQQFASKTYGNEPFSVKAVSKSIVPITYSISPSTSTCATVDPTTGMVTISCVPPGNIFSVVAHQALSSQFKDATDTINIFVTKALPVVTLYTLPGLIKNKNFIFDYKLPDGYASEAGASVTVFQSSGEAAATFDNTTNIIHGNTSGPFEISLTLAATGNFKSLDTTFTFKVYDAAVPPTAVADTLILYRNNGVLGDGKINLLKNDFGVTSHLSINLTDIDIINPGNQNIFYSPPIGTFELNQQTGDLTVHPAAGLTGTAWIGYTVTDSSGVESNVTYVVIEILNLQDLPDMKANEVMTPNLDGKNDVLFIAYTDVNKSNYISILDETGNTIYETKNYQNDWTAKDNKGNEVEAGVYFFVFNEEEGQGRILRGYIQVVR